MDGRSARRALIRAARGLTASTEASLFEREGSNSILRATETTDPSVHGYRVDLGDSEACVVQTWTSQNALFVPELVDATSEVHRRAAIARGTRSAYFMPLLTPQRLLAVVVCAWNRPVAAPSGDLAGELDDLAAAGAEAILRGDILDVARSGHRGDAAAATADLEAWDRHLAECLGRRRTRAGVCVALLRMDQVDDDDRRDDMAAAVASWSACLRSADFLARHGYGEFGLIFDGLGAGAAVRLTERLREVSPAGWRLSIGLAEWDGIEPPHALVRRADEALYLAGGSGSTILAE